jgi:hypothetical protein
VVGMPFKDIATRYSIFMRQVGMLFDMLCDMLCCYVVDVKAA